MPNSRRWMIAGFFVFAVALGVSERRLLAATCGQGEVAPGSSCGCTGWITLVWDGAWGNCTGTETSDTLCAAGVCNLYCNDTALVGDQLGYSCQSNQWSSYIGFRCGDFCEG